MKEIFYRKTILLKISNNLALLFMLNIIYTFMCDISISKLNKDVLKDFDNYKVAIFLNYTHFSCDNGQNVLDLPKFNDDFCDCKDGSDENSKLSTFIYFKITLNI